MTNITNTRTYRYLTLTLFVQLLCLTKNSFAQDASIFSKNGHIYELITASFSPDNKILLTVDRGYNCIIWDAAIGTQIQTIKGISAASFVGSNETICAVTSDGDVKILNLTGTLVKKISKLNSQTRFRQKSVLYPEAGIFLSGSSVFDIYKGLLLEIPRDGYTHPDAVYSNARKQFITCSSWGDSINFYDISSRKRAFSLLFDKKGDHRPYLNISKDGRYLTKIGPSSLTVFDLDTRQPVLNFPKPAGASIRNGTAISPDGKQLIFWTSLNDKNKEQVSLVDIKSGQKIWTREYEPLDRTDYYQVAFSEDGKRIILGNHKKLINIEVNGGKELASFNSYAPIGFDGLYNTMDNNRLIFYMGADTNRIVFWNLLTGQMENVASFVPGSFYPHMSMHKPFPNGKKLAGFSGNNIVELDTAGKLLCTYPPLPANAVPKSMDLSYDGKYILRTYFSETCRGGLEVFDCTTRKKVFSKPCGLREVVFAKTQNIIAILEGQEMDMVRLYEMPSGKILKQVKVPRGSFFMRYSEDDRFIAMETEGKSSMSPKDDNIGIIDVKKGTFKEYSNPNPDPSSDPPNMIQFTSDGKYLICHNMGILYYLDLEQQKYTKTYNLGKNLGWRPSKISFSKDGRMVFVNGNYAAVTVFHLESQKILARLYPDIRRKDWAVVTPDGRFDGNDGALESMFHAKGDAIVPLSAMYEKFYTPRLLPRILAGEKFDPVNVDVNDLKKTPVVKMEFKESSRNLEVDDDIKTIVSKSAHAVITVTASCPQDAVSEIRLYQNGKLIETTRNLEVDDDNTSKTLTRTFQVGLLHGNNSFRAIALNSQRSESKPLDLLVQYTADKTSPSTNTNSALHVVVVGINAYKNAKYNLNYAKPDAEAFKSAIENGTTGIFSKVYTHFITDADASKAGISTALEKVKQTAQPQDLFIFYYAGHGVVNDQKEFFLVPSDVTQLYGNDEGLAKNGLSATHLQKFSKEIKAQKQLYILDACQSAGALDNIVASRGAAEEKAIAQLARSTGTHWLTASGSTQFASEFAQLGHGSFTYCLLEAFKGKADNGDKKLTVKELDAYLQVRVPEITQQYKGSAQYPASFGYGNDFPFFIIK